MFAEENTEEITQNPAQDNENTANPANSDENNAQNQEHGNEHEADESHELEAPETDEQKIHALTAEVNSLNEKLAQTQDRLLRIAAEADNTRKRLEKEKQDARLYSIQNFALDLLPVIDSFDKALQTIKSPESAAQDGSTQIASIVEGVKLVSKIFNDVLHKHGIERVPGQGEPFNPNYHNAIAKETDAKYDVETVIEEFMTGYKIQDRVLRTALVKVGSPD